MTGTHYAPDMVSNPPPPALGNGLLTYSGIG